MQQETFFDKSFVQNVVVGSVFFIFGFIRGIRNNGFIIIPILRQIKVLLTGKKYILIWNDHSVETSKKITTLLKRKSPKYRYKELRSAEHLLRYPIKINSVHMVMIIVTDVTKLSEIEKRRDRIQLRLGNYVRAGGTLFGTHDIIYKRCRNNHLQETFGCEVCNFQRVHQPVPVVIQANYIKHPLVDGLPESFDLDDGEVCWGDWSRDAKILIRTKEKFRNNMHGHLEYVPTLVVRHTGSLGTMIWLNCADKTDKLPKSLNEPQSEVVTIMVNAINKIDEIKQYYLDHN